MHHACDVLVAPPAVRAAFCGLLKNCTVADPMALLHSAHHGQAVWKYMCPRNGTKEGVLDEIRKDLLANGVDPCGAGIVAPAPSTNASVAAPPQLCCGTNKFIPCIIPRRRIRKKKNRSTKLITRRG